MIDDNFGEWWWCPECGEPVEVCASYGTCPNSPISKSHISSKKQENEMEKSLHEICVEAVNKMVEENISHHVSYISGEDAVSFGLKEGGKIPKVTIEWVEEAEALPENRAG